MSIHFKVVLVSEYLQHLESDKSFFLFEWISSLLSPNENPTFSTAGLPVHYNRDNNIVLLLTIKIIKEEHGTKFLPMYSQMRQ